MSFSLRTYRLGVATLEVRRTDHRAPRYSLHVHGGGYVGWHRTSDVMRAAQAGDGRRTACYTVSISHWGWMRPVLGVESPYGFWNALRLAWSRSRERREALAAVRAERRRGAA